MVESQQVSGARGTHRGQPRRLLEERHLADDRPRCVVRVDLDLVAVDELDDLDLTAMQDEGTVGKGALVEEHLACFEIHLVHHLAQPREVGGVEIGEEGHHAEEPSVVSGFRTLLRLLLAAHPLIIRPVRLVAGAPEKRHASFRDRGLRARQCAARGSPCSCPIRRLSRTYA
nr:hypothetical protein [Humibacillus xanthopallidus]